MQEYNSTPHTVRKFPPNYLMYAILPFQPSFLEIDVYLNVDEARKLHVHRTILNHNKSKVYYDDNFRESIFKVYDLLIYQKF